MLTTQYFDAVGRLLSVTDSSGARTEYAYNAVNQITTITDALGGETSFTYDANGNLLTLTDARGKTTTWIYDSMDRAATRLDPLTRSIRSFGTARSFISTKSTWANTVPAADSQIAGSTTHEYRRLHEI